jgi:type VI secretion system protein ImpK
LARRSLGRLAGDFVTYVQLLREAPAGLSPSVQSLRGQLNGLLESFTRSVGPDDASPDEIEEARFALVAWADETILRAGWPGFEEWQREPLQMQLYRTTRAGNEFFDHLARLRPEQLAAREVYFLVMALGFEGQYLGQEAERRALIAHQFEVLRAAGRTLEVAREHRVTPGAYELEISLPRGGGFGVFGWLGLMALGVAAVYGVLWLVLYLTAPEVPLPRGL